jgi:hypothetical protein
MCDQYKYIVGPPYKLSRLSSTACVQGSELRAIFESGTRCARWSGHLLTQSSLPAATTACLDDGRIAEWNADARANATPNAIVVLVGICVPQAALRTDSATRSSRLVSCDHSRSPPHDGSDTSTLTSGWWPAIDRLADGGRDQSVLHIECYCRVVRKPGCRDRKRVTRFEQRREPRSHPRKYFTRDVAILDT